LDSRQRCRRCRWGRPGRADTNGTSHGHGHALQWARRAGRRDEETDLVAEADIYIAYGRYREAETLLEKALEGSPHRLDVEYKLIEAYHGTRDRQRMKALMDRMQSTDDDWIDPEQWQRLTTMLEDLKGTGIEGPYPTAAIAGEESPTTDSLSTLPKNPGTPISDSATLRWPKD